MHNIDPVRNRSDRCLLVFILVLCLCCFPLLVLAVLALFYFLPIAGDSFEIPFRHAV
jgi:hypothetical protein